MTNHFPTLNVPDIFRFRFRLPGSFKQLSRVIARRFLRGRHHVTFVTFAAAIPRILGVIFV